MRLFLPLAVLIVVLMLPSAAHAQLAADDIRQTLASPQALSVEDYILTKNDLQAFYAARDYTPAWNFTGTDNARAFASFITSIEQVIDYHGLRPEDYATGLMRKLALDGDAHALRLELLTSDTLLRLAHDLHGDGNELDDLYPGWNFHRAKVDIPALLAKAVANNAINEFIDGVAPKNLAYGELARALQTYTAIAKQGGWGTITPGPIMREDAADSRLPQLCARLIAEGYLTKTFLCPQRYDTGLREAVRAYQLHHGLDADGNAGPKTVEQMNVPIRVRIDQIRANMERWRHMPDDFPPGRYALINIAEQTLVITDDGRKVYEGPVIVGKVDRKTPFIQSKIRSMIINPAWHVPVKIAKKDILPKLRQDPHYLEKLGFVIRGNPDDPYGENIDWASMPAREFNLRLRQSPGDMNSLGRLKFDFDNDFAVYMHGTPHEELFDKPERTFSSGCVRLHDPEEVGEILMSGTEGGWTVQKIRDEIDSDKTRWVGIKNPMPIYILYWTAWVDSAGAVNFRRDIYDYDTLLMTTPNTPIEGNQAP